MKLSKLFIAALFASTTITMVGCATPPAHMLQGRAVDGSYSTYRVTLPTDTVVYKDGTTKQFAEPTTYLNLGFKDKCEGKVRLIQIDGQDAELITHQFDHYSAGNRPACQTK